jgi:Fe2+ or Zn2+ uptake regulation protein
MAHDHDLPDPAGLAHEVAARLATVNQRLTATRRAIVEALAAADRPMSIPEILGSGSGLAQSSVYRNLAVLERAGVVSRVVTTDEWARFELSEVLTGHHHHLVCSKCGAVDDVRVPDDVEADLDRALGVLARREGFELLHHRLDLVGVCRACR